MRLSNHWNFLIALLPTIGTFGQVFTTHDSRFGVEAVRSAYRSIDIAVTDPARNPDYAPWMRQTAVPALVDVGTRIGVTITGTVAQAQAQLNVAITNQLPAIARERDNDVREASRGVRTAAASANSVPALRDQVARLAQLVEQLQERVEQLERD